MMDEGIKKETSSSLDEILEYLFSDDTLSSLVIFKGGTALAKAYGIKRFSKDIDLSYVGKGYGNIINDVKVFIEGLGLKIINMSSNAIEFKIGTLRSSVDVSYLRDVINLSVKTKSIVSDKGSGYFVRVMDIDEILAEKIRAITERREGKDLWDTYMILEKGVTCTAAQINYKCEHSNPPFSFSEAGFIKVVDSWTEHRYRGQIRDYVKEEDMVPLSDIKKKLTKFIRSVN